MNKQIFYISTLFLISCAKVVAPAGGPKDIEGPKVVSVTPNNKNINFLTKNQDIRIKFDEFFQLKDITKQIVMSPPQKESPEYLINGKELVIKFKEELQKKTTYTINFGNSITDNHEGITAKNIQYTFSTGNYIDSNFISGKVHNAFTNLPAEGIVVSLYKKSTFSDTTIYKLNPTYFTKTKEDGSFLIENMPIENYMLYAYKKEGIDLKYTKNDSIAIYNYTINTGDKNSIIPLYLFKPNEYKPNKIFDTVSTQLGVYNFAVYKPVNFKIIGSNNDKIYFKTLKNINGIDTIKVFVNNNTDSFRFKITTNDSSFYKTIISKKKSKKPEFILNSKSELSPLDTIFIETSVPIKYINRDSIIIKEDTNILKPSYFEIDSNKMKIAIYNIWKESTKYSVDFKDSTLRDIFNTYNKKSIYNYDIKSFKEYGNLFLNVELINAKHNYIVQLLDNSTNAVLRSFNVNKSTNLKMEYLNPVLGKIKIIEDLNNNGLWDNGDLDSMLYPERTFISNQLINVRAYWDIEQSININDIISQQ
ncbi:MAG: Ig-like domain-containing protein [Bacteroidia bacterium]|nr:Ig-like domain-containing protein [Bacteroidia bacterium]